jgi:hypothetical protein
LLAGGVVAVLALLASDAGATRSGSKVEPRTSASAASATARFYRSALEGAKRQLDQPAAPVAAQAHRAHAPGSALGPLQGDASDPEGGSQASTTSGGHTGGGPPVIRVTIDEGTTCQGTTCTTSTCQHFVTCNGTHTCTQTCSSYPTCTGGPSMCTQTCSSYPTCNGTTTCTSTCSSWATCNGNGLPTQQCNSTCSSYPTCFTTCNGSGPTCGPTPSCTHTCGATYPTCVGATCTSGNCRPTTNAAYVSCSGGPPSYCAETCAAYATCAGFDNPQCQGSGVLARLGDGPWALALAALGSVVVVRRRKAERAPRA